MPAPTDSVNSKPAQYLWERASREAGAVFISYENQCQASSLFPIAFG